MIPQTPKAIEDGKKNGSVWKWLVEKTHSVRSQPSAPILGEDNPCQSIHFEAPMSTYLLSPPTPGQLKYHQNYEVETTITILSDKALNRPDLMEHLAYYRYSYHGEGRFFPLVGTALALTLPTIQEVTSPQTGNYKHKFTGRLGTVIQFATNYDLQSVQVGERRHAKINWESQGLKSKTLWNVIIKLKRTPLQGWVLTADKSASLCGVLKLLNVDHEIDGGKEVVLE